MMRDEKDDDDKVDDDNDDWFSKTSNKRPGVATRMMT